MLKMELLELEALLTDRERICLAGYLLMRDDDDKAYVKAYTYSRSYTIVDTYKAILDKAQKWISQPKVQAFIQLWEEKGKIMQQSVRAASVVNQREDEQRQLTAIEEIIQRYENLYKETDDIEEKAKILKMIVDARHKNKDDVKDDVSAVQIYLPIRCSECVLYKKEQDNSL